MEGLNMSYINHPKYLGDRFKPRMVWERSISRYVAVLFQSQVSNFQNEANKKIQKWDSILYINRIVLHYISQKSIQI
jgi:hypothetical protein